MISRQIYVIVLALFLNSLLSRSLAETASFYTPPYTPSSCDGFKEEGVMIAAASEEIWDNSAACGRKYKIKCVGGTNQGVTHPCKSGKSVTVKIIDLCPTPGCQATIDLSQEAFSAIADLNEGIIKISLTRA